LQIYALLMAMKSLDFLLLFLPFKFNTNNMNHIVYERYSVWTAGVWFLTGARDSSPFYTVQTGSPARLASCLIRSGGLSPRG
jgi:hypothetical protein